MSEIRVLDPHVADLIAAGEVVERPASVVKELMENAIDAGAAHVTVEIASGGMSFIRVTDDGCGIPAEEVATAFLRHATSKISTEYDLEAIGTLGFRGEALAAIAAVAKVEVLTRTAAAPLGTALTLEGGVVTAREEAGCPLGTTMVVRDLFFNTPARLKFMKRDQAEGAAVFAVVQREALSHPEVSVKFIREGRQELLTPGDGRTESAMYAVFGRDIALGFLPVRGGGEEVEVSGFVSIPACCRGSRSYQHFFVNGRYVKSRALQAAVEEAYKNQKMVGKFPGCVLHLACKPGRVDVNVHPTKIEVKFAAESRVFSEVYHAVLSALGGGGARPATLPPPEEREPPIPARPPLAPPEGERGTTLPLRTPEPPEAPARPPLPEMAPPPVPRAEHTQEPPSEAWEKAEDIPAPGKEEPEPERIAPDPALNVPVNERPAPRKGFKPAGRPVDVPPPEEELGMEQLPSAEEPWTVRGELFRTYILVEQGERALLIDKHAAHERMNFDRLRAQRTRPMLQQLLVPLALRPAPEEKEILLAHLPLLEEFGFAVEDFGGDALLVRQIPDGLEETEAEPALLEVARRFLTGGTADPAGARDALLSTMACKLSIKGGWRSGPEELERVAAAVMSGEVKYCPHGRPVAIELTKKQLEKQFKRA